MNNFHRSVKKYGKHILFSIAFISFIMLSGCSDKDKGPAPVLTADSDEVTFTVNGGNSTLTVIMNGSRWVVTSSQSWCTVMPQTSVLSSVPVTVTATSNSSYDVRTAVLKFVMDNKDTLKINVRQDAKTKIVYPDYSNPISADATGMSSNAKTIISKIAAGWNLGNSLEVPGGETGWGNPLTTQLLIDSVKAAGINAVRIPCAWDSYIDNITTCKIKDSWLSRVKQVVDYCYADNMYVMINIHWDGGWMNNPSYANQDEINAKLKAIWQQIAVYFRNYDEHLIFAAMNEVTCNNPTTENYTVQNSFSQTFVDAVRSTGGKNAYRNLAVQAFNTNIDLAVSNMVIPTDNTSNRLIVEVHYYDPWDFAGLEADATWATVKNFWGAPYAQYGPESGWAQEDYVISQFQKMKTNFVDKGYPVILGEFGAVRRSTLTGSTLEHHLASRAYYVQYVAQQAKNHGMAPFYWDNGANGNLTMAIFNRSNGTAFDRQILNSYLIGASAGTYPF
jgi:endoglucanase